MPLVRSLIAVVLAALAASPGTARPADMMVDLELVLAVDISGSIDPDEATLQRQGYVAALNDPRVINAIRSGPHGRIAVAYVEWAGAGNTWTLVDWTLIAGRDDALAFAGDLGIAPATSATRTSISGAIAYAIPLFEGNGYTGRRRVIDVSGDGPNNDGPPVTSARDRAVARGITINGLPIINNRPNRFGFPGLADLDLYYENCVIGGPGSFQVVARGFPAFPAAILRKLIREIAGAPPARVRRAQGFRPPPCDIGERQLREYFRLNPLSPF
jgi:hypothetical protein